MDNLYAIDKCPICGTPLVANYRDYMDYLLMELDQECPNRHYAYNYAHGNSRIYVGEEEFFEHYTDSPERAKATQQALRAAEEKLKQEWLLCPTSKTSPNP